MKILSRERLCELMEAVLKAQGKALPTDEDIDLRDIGFRSLDFSELALRVEDEVGYEIETVGDVLTFLEQLQAV